MLTGYDPAGFSTDNETHHPAVMASDTDPFIFPLLQAQARYNTTNSFVVLNRQLEVRAAAISLSQARNLVQELLEEPVPEVGWIHPEQNDLMDSIETEDSEEKLPEMPTVNPFDEEDFGGSACSLGPQEQSGPWAGLLALLGIAAGTRRRR